MKAELAQLIAIQKTDTNIRTLQTEIESIPERRAEIEREFDQRAFEIRALEQKKETASHERARVETEIFEQKHRLERAEKNLKAVKKPDEYTAAIREADAARKQISARDAGARTNGRFRHGRERIEGTGAGSRKAARRHAGAVR